MADFYSKSEAHDYLEAGVKQGRFKPCGHLVVVLYNRHHLKCKENSFGNNRNLDDYCPPNCRYFIDKNAAEEQVRRAKLKNDIKRGIKKTFETIGKGFVFFRSLPALVQALLIVFWIIISLPRYQPLILEILKAMHGK